MPELEINVQFKSDAQSLDAKANDVRAATAGFARMIIDNVALALASEAYQKARTSLVSGIKRAVANEVSRMANLISSTLALPANRTGPEGPMSIKEGMSTTAQRLGMRSTYNREDSGITWKKRDKGYMKWKRRKGFPSDWFHAKGKLVQDLKSPTLYQRAFGPLVVTFTPPKAVRGAGGRFQRPLRPMLGNGNLPGAFDPRTKEQDTGIGPNVTRSGRKGGSSDYEVGRLEVAAFGKITPAMLPALADMENDDAIMRKPGGVGVAALMPRTKEKKIQQKLLHRGDKQRLAIDPYVSFFLTRAIPNAVWRRTERLVGDAV